MLRILKFEQAEGNTLRDMLRKNGIECEVVESPFTVPNRAGVEVFGKVWRYSRPGTGQPIWILEVDIYLSASERVTRSWVLDVKPTSTQIDTIIVSNAQAGAVIE